MIDFVNKTVKMDFVSMAELQESLGVLYCMANSQPTVDCESVCMYVDAIAKSAGVDLTDAAFPDSKQIAG